MTNIFIIGFSSFTFRFLLWEKKKKFTWPTAGQCRHVLLGSDVETNGRSAVGTGAASPFHSQSWSGHSVHETNLTVTFTVF